MIDFATFFAAAHADSERSGPAPYPWQSALAQRLAIAAPPRAIVVPTGGGKTATIDALIWALACQARRSPLLRTIGVRTVWAIDRRILVDEVHEHVERLAERLAEAAGDHDHPLHAVADALRSLTDGGPPLVATRWRGGGIVVDREAHHPFQPEVITSTVAQVGSRLLFRGYGVGRRSLSLQAALAAVDTTICLDEAHLAEPFRETVEAVVAARVTESVALPPLHLVTLTATPSRRLEPAQVASITAADRALLGARLTGVKRARLVEPSSKRERALALVAAVGEHLAAGAATVACIVNTVKAAVDVHAALLRAHGDLEHMVLIGPQRPVDRAEQLERHRGTLFARVRPAVPLILVATQTFEVGLDADVEALVTESASASALVQRLGRLNRAGLRDGQATIVRADGPGLYEAEEPAAWTWLRSLEQPDGAIDVSVDALTNDARRPAPVASAPAPELSPDVLERLVQTEPRPAMMDDPDIDAFLRGASTEPAADVSVAWRADLREEDPHADAYREALLRLAPPEPDECLTLGIGRARALLAALRGDPAQRNRLAGRVLDEPDLEGGLGGGELSPILQDGGALLYVVLRGGEHLESPAALRPGDVLVLPSSAGGYSGRALDLAATGPVSDVGPDRRAKRMSAAPFWRLGREALQDLSAAKRKRILSNAERAAKAATEDQQLTTLEALAERLAAELGHPREQLGLADATTLDLRRLTPVHDRFADGEVELEEDEDESEEGDETGGLTMADDAHESEDAYVLLVRRRDNADELRLPRAPPPTLDAHARAVTERTRQYVTRAGLSASIAATLVTAARAHDHGKADPRTQAFFRGGGAGLTDVALAKSVFGTQDVRADRSARRAAGLPVDLRHEVESVSVLLDALAHGGVADRPLDVEVELLLHLVGTHHGLGRPVPRMPHGGASPRVYAASAAGIDGAGSGDGGAAWAGGAWLDRFLTVTDRYGPWGSAYLAALLVLADRTVSKEGA